MNNEELANYGQIDFNLPHDIVPLPSGGIFYKSKKKNVKVGYLTASDENILANINGRKTIKETIIIPLLRSKLYEHDLRPEELLEGDVEAILLFLRNTSFGPEYTLNLTDPKTGNGFEATVLLDELNINKSKVEPDENGLFTVTLPTSNTTVKLKMLSLLETVELDKLIEYYPEGYSVPIVTTRLSKMVVEVNGDTDKAKIATFCNNMPIRDSKFVRNFMRDNEPRLNLNREVIAPSGEKVNVPITFGVEFFRPFF
jgi:hypothetical protein